MSDDIKMERDTLERMAMENADPEDYYDLLDEMDTVTDDQLVHLAGLDDQLTLNGKPNPKKSKQPISTEIDKKFRIEEVGSRTIYTYTNDPERVAFIEKGDTLSTTDSNPALIKNMLLVAEDKGWKSITLKGTDKFRREAWMEAKLRGMDVKGHEPSEQDLRHLNAELSKREQPAGKSTQEIDAPEQPNRPAMDAVSEEGKLLRAKELKTAMATLEKDEAVKKFPELKEVYDLQPSAIAFYRQQGGLAAEQESSFVTRVTDRAIEDIADGRNVPKFDVNSYKSFDVDPINTQNREIDFD